MTERDIKGCVAAFKEAVIGGDEDVAALSAFALLEHVLINFNAIAEALHFLATEKRDGR